MIYGVLLFLRNMHLSAFQRTLTLVMTKGAANEQSLLTLNKLALTLSPTSKLKILEECEEMTSQKAKEMASSCCLCNLVGDNCDFRIQPRHVTASIRKPTSCSGNQALLVTRGVSSISRTSCGHPMSTAK